MDINKTVQKEKNTTFKKNVIMLMISQILIKIMGFIYKLVIINVPGFGDVGNGYYNTGYQLYALLLTVSSIGIPTVISKLVAEKIAIGDNKGAHKIFKTALKLFTGIGIFFSLVLFFGAEFIATDLLNVPAVKYTLMVLAPAIAMVSASAVIRGYFSGLGTMKATSVSQTIEQLFNCVLSITFVYCIIGQDPAIMAAAGNLSTTLAVLISFSYLLIYYRRRRNGIFDDCKNSEVISEDKTSFGLVKMILAVSIPMTIGSIISVINSTIDTFTISNCIQSAFSGIIQEKDALVNEAMRLAGLLSKTENIIHLPLAINGALGIALVPTVSSLLSKGEKKAAENRILISLFISILIILPSAIGLVVLAEPVLKLLYPTASDGAFILQLTTITMILVGLNSIANNALYGMGKIKIPAMALGIGVVVKLVLNIVLISNPAINIYGATIGSIACQLISCVICYIYLFKYFTLDIKFTKHILKPIVASCIMGASVYIVFELLTKVISSNAITTTLAILIGIVIYGIMIIALKTLSKDEILLIPGGNKIYLVLANIGIYK